MQTQNILTLRRPLPAPDWRARTVAARRKLVASRPMMLLALPWDLRTNSTRHLPAWPVQNNCQGRFQAPVPLAVPDRRPWQTSRPCPSARGCQVHISTPGILTGHNICHEAALRAFARRARTTAPGIPTKPRPFHAIARRRNVKAPAQALASNSKPATLTGVFADALSPTLTM